MSKKTIFVVGGGTGGHLFPAIALGEELMDRGYSYIQATGELVNGVHFRRKIIPFSKIRESYPDPFKVGKDGCTWNDYNQPSKKKKATQPNPHHLFR